MPPFLRPLPRAVTRPLSVLVLLAWVAAMAALVNRSYLQASSANLATDLARYGSAAAWRGVYYRGEKIGFTVSQTVPTDDGFELQENGRLQMSLLGATTAATIRTTARVDTSFALRSFEFSLDPGTGPIEVRGRVDGPSPARSTSTTPSGTRTRGARAGRAAGAVAEPVAAAGERRPRAGRAPSSGRLRSGHAPQRAGDARRRQARAGAQQRHADAGVPRRDGVRRPAHDVVDHRHRRSRARGEPARADHRPRVARAARGRWRCRAACRRDLLAGGGGRARDARAASTSRATSAGCACGSTARISPRPIIDGGGADASTATSSSCAIRRRCSAGPRRPGRRALPGAGAVHRERRAGDRRRSRDRRSRGVDRRSRARAERLTRYVNALLEKKPTVSLPSAREVLRTKVGDCNEHTALYVAMARALGIPARIAVGLVYVHGAFYYHAWPEVYLDEGGGPRPLAAGRSDAQPVSRRRDAPPARARRPRQAGGDPAAHRPAEDDGARSRARRRARRRSWSAAQPADLGALAMPIPQRERRCCACDDAPMIAIHDLVKQLRHVHRRRRRQPRRARRARSTASSARTAPARRRRSG